MQPLTEDRKNTIGFYLRQGFSYHKTARIVKVSSSTVHKIRLELGLPARNDKGGRPKALTKRVQQHVFRAVTTNGLENSAQAQQ
jgi:transposase